MGSREASSRDVKAVKKKASWRGQTSRRGEAASVSPEKQ